MTASELLSELLSRNVQLWRDGDHLRVRAPRGVLTPELQAELALNKSGVMDVLPRQENERNELPAIVTEPAHRHEPFQLTDIQQAYWVGRSEAIELGNVACHAYYEVDADGIDLSRLTIALNKLIERHDMLRAVVLPDGRQQVLEKVPAYELEVEDLRRFSKEAGEAELASIRDRMSHQILPADQWPLFEIRATRLNAVRTRLHFSFDVLIADVLSLQILFREWEELYRDSATELPAIEITFRDYTLARARMQDTESHRLAQRYWSERLPTLPGAPDLPLASDPRSLTNPRFARLSGRLSAEEWNRLKQRGAERGLTPSAVLLAAFGQLLSRWSTVPRFSINVTLFNRLPLHRQVNEIIGDFTTLMPIELDHSQVESFEAGAARLQEQLLEGMEHRLATGVQLMRDLARIQGNQAGAALPVVFTSLLAKHNSTDRPEKILWMGETVFGITQTPQVWLDHQVLEDHGELVFNWDAVEDLFPRGMLKEIFDGYVSLLHLLSGDERSWIEPARNLVPSYLLDQCLSANQAEVKVPETLLHSLFENQALERPDKAAVIAVNGRLTYDELLKESVYLGSQLRRLGAQPNTLVAVVMEKGWEQVAAVLGVLYSGAAYLPIDPCLPKERLWHLLADGEVKLALTQSAIDERLDWPPNVLRLKVDTESIIDNVEPIENVQSPDDLAYVIYTSGSTGKPKGVMINHRGAVNTILDINRRFDVKASDKCLAISSLGFDLSVYDIFGTLAAGGTIVMPDSTVMREPARWEELIESEGVTVWNSVPAFMELLVEQVGAKRPSPLKSLQLVLLSGDWVRPDLPDRIREVASNSQVISLGGATEASIWSILYPTDHGCSEMKRVPYGKPMSNQQMYVLNASMEPCPTWVQGELYIGGTGLALGYWRDEKRTNAAFVSHPRTGERLYRTGDLGRYLPDGNIDFMGRQDLQIKVQGYRIEPGEIEAALQNHPGIKAAAATAVESRANRRLVAFIVAERDLAPTSADVAEFLGQRLPAYMIPSRFIFVDALPLSTNGKLDRRALSRIAEPLSPSSSPKAAETKSIGDRIAACVARALNLDHVRSDANLLALGINSIDVIRAATLIEKEFGIRPRVEEFYQKLTCENLAASLQEGILSKAEKAVCTTIRGFRAGLAVPTISWEAGEV